MMVRKLAVWLLSTIFAAVCTTILAMAYFPNQAMETALSGHFSVELLWLGFCTAGLMVCLQQLFKEMMS
ncbi:hypothetical protein R3M36_004664 [Salmonella enterica]|nr:hypothetical protein [Salmonella enterica]